MKIKAHAKINLTLNIIGKREDGYHDVDMIMQSIGLCDIITIEKILTSIELSGTGSLSYDETNLAYKAAKLFFDVTGIRSGARIFVDKRIPMCAGMAGGSSDAAAVLKGLNMLYGKPLSQRVLSKISSKLGADVPYCLMGSTARATGIGDIIVPIKPFGTAPVVIVKPPVAVSTPKAYASLDYPSLVHPDANLAQDAIERGDRQALYNMMENSFELSVFKSFPVIKDIKSKMISMGADASLMSGSGSAVFGIFENEEKAKEAYNYFKDMYKDVFLTQTV